MSSLDTQAIPLSRRSSVSRRGGALVLCAGMSLLQACGDGDERPVIWPPDEVSPSVAMDVLPGTYPNRLDVSSTELVEVAVLGSEAFDAKQLDARASQLGDASGKNWVGAKEARPAKDVDGDGRLDALLVFSVAELTQKQVLTPESSTVRLRARTKQKGNFVGRDGLADSKAPQVVLPAPKGPHAVGTFERAWTDTGRDEVFTTAAGDKREVLVRVWYPASVPSGAQPAPYFLQLHEAEFLAESLELPSPAFGFVYSHSYQDAAMVSGSERHPVVLFSPGYGMSRILYSAVAEELASRGYVVAAMAHTYSAPVAFPDGRKLPQTVQVTLEDEALNRKIQDAWTADARFVLDQLTAVNANDPKGRLTGRLDLERVGMFGHSFGGSTSAEACRVDARFKAGINMDGTFFGQPAAGATVPFFMLAAGREEKDPSWETFSQNLKGPGYWARVEGAQHANFGDIQLLMPLVRAYAPDFDPASIDLGPIEGARGYTLSSVYPLAFFDKHLRGLSTPLLNGNSSDYPEVDLTVYPR
ncbi:hypothetical protein NVS55_12830 [Myxococcus stipitatus]|uniref:alpha/beta hydrolase family protein n=1 Tax=Myxococcus stipitatus TaxID=83455 RepID=UPI0031456756